MICSKLLDYNLVDVEGLVLLNEEFNIIEDQFEQAQLVVAPPEDGIFTSKLHDHDVIRDFRNKMVFDTKYQKWERTPIKGKPQIGKKFTITLKDLEEQAKRGGRLVEYKSLHDIHKVGGYVPPPLRVGTFEWIVTIDFSKQYPNAILSSNAGIQTAIKFKYEDETLGDYIIDTDFKRWKREDLIETPIGYFRKDIDSVNRSKFKKWLKFRELAQDKADKYLFKVKDQEDPMFKLLDGKQFRIKIFTNGGFGVMGYKKDRNYSVFVFNSCTLMCQDLTKKMINTVHELGYETIGGDTDSCFPILKSDNLDDAEKEAKWLVDEVNKVIDKYLDEVYNIQEHSMYVGLETISDKFIVKAAKNYVKRNVWKDGTRLDEPQLEIKGISMKKRNTSQFSADMQSVLVGILMDSDDIPRDFKILMEVIDKNFSSFPWEYIAPKGALNNKIDDYDIGNRNARGARNARDYLNVHFQPGDNPYIMPFKEFPKKLNGKFVSPYKGDSLALSFDKENISNLMKLGFRPDMEDLKRSQVYLKAEPFLKLIDTDFYKIQAQTKVSSDMIL